MTWNCKMKRQCSVLCLSLLVIMAGIHANAQSSWGYTNVYYDPYYDWIGAYAVTSPDYSTQFYYDPKVSIILSGTDGFYDSYYCYNPSWCQSGNDAWVGLTAPPTPGANYTSTAYHYLDVYYSYYDVDPWCTFGCSDWYDAYGYSYAECSPSCRADPTCYCVDAIGHIGSWTWYPPIIAVLTYLGEEYLGESEDEEISPVPALIVRNGGSLVSAGSTVHITAGSATSPPQMPVLSTQLVGGALAGSTTWRIGIQYSGNGRSDSDSFPVGGSTTLPSTQTWATHSDFGGSHRGGTATIRYRYSNQPERSFSFQIRGTNPTEADVKGKVGNSPWFLSRLIRQESAFRQFNGQDPLFGSPNGWGMMQIDPPPGPQEIWNWWWNTDVGKSRLTTKQSELNVTWTNRINDWQQWNAQNPTKQVGPPSDRQEGTQCLFTWNGGNYGSEQTKSFKDGCWIKRYNGAVSDYLFWDDVSNPDDQKWAINDSAGYVNDVCSKNP